MSTMWVETPRCTVCNEKSYVEVDQDAYAAWKHKDKMIQHAFPEMLVEEREMLLTGIHPACWAKVFPQTDEE